jgi:glycosyltransferase 2 family protein
VLPDRPAAQSKNLSSTFPLRHFSEQTLQHLARGCLDLPEACCYGSNPMPRNARRWVLLVLVLGIIGFFLYRFRGSITLEGFRWSMVGQSLREARISLLVLALVAIYACYAIRAARWVHFCRWLGETRFGSVYAATLAGFSCTVLLGRAAEPVRPVLIARKSSISMPSMFGVYVLERVADMAATALLAGGALLFFERHGGVGSDNALLLKLARSAGVLLLAALVAAIAFLVYFRYHGARWLAKKLEHPNWRTGWRAKFAELLQGFSDGLRGVRTWGDLAALAAYTAIHWLLVVFIYLWVAHAFGGELARLSFAGAALVLAFTMVGSAAQLPGVGGGSQLASFLVFTLIFGVDKEPAAVATIVTWLITFVGCCVIGLPLLFREGWSVGELKRMARAEEKAGEAELLAEAEHGGEPAAGPQAPSKELSN